jgi:hypothetical protein
VDRKLDRVDEFELRSYQLLWRPLGWLSAEQDMAGGAGTASGFGPLGISQREEKNPWG